MYYIRNGLGEKWQWMAALFCVFGMIAALGTGCMTQINTIATSIGSVVTSFNPATSRETLEFIYLVVGVCGAFLTILVLFGGLQRIGSVTEKLVPVMALVYIVGSLIVISGCSTKALQKPRTALDTRGERLRCFEFDEMDGI